MLCVCRQQHGGLMPPFWVRPLFPAAADIHLWLLSSSARLHQEGGTGMDYCSNVQAENEGM